MADRSILTSNQLLTVVKETEATIDSRPIVYVGDGINSGTPLTPARFVSLNPNVALSNFNLEDDYDISFNLKVNSQRLLSPAGRKE